MDAADLVGRQAQQLGQRLLQRPDALAVGPDRDPAVLPFRDRAGRADGAVHEERPGITRAQGPGVRRRLRSGIGEHRHRRGGQGAQRRVQVPGRQGRRGALPSAGLQHAQGLDRRPLPLGQHGGEAAVADHLHHARHALGRREVGRPQHRAVAGAADHAGVQHGGRAHVVDVGCGSGELGGDVDPAQAGPDQPDVARRLARDVGEGLHVQVQPGGELAIAERTPVRRGHPAAAGDDLTWLQVPAFRGLRGQQHPHIGRGVQDGRAAVLHRVAAGGDPLVGGAPGVGGDQGEAARIEFQLVRRQLDQRSLDALAELDLAGEDGGAALRVDGDPAVQPGIFG